MGGMVLVFPSSLPPAVAPVAAAGGFLSAADQVAGQLTLVGWVFYPLLFFGVALMLFCVLTIHRQPHLTELQKLKWLLFTLFLPFVGPLAYLLRLRADRRAGRLEPSSDSQTP